MPTPPKLCIDCRHCLSGVQDYRCTHPLVQHVSPVTGEPIRVECLSARMSPCGADAKLFEPKEGAA